MRATASRSSCGGVWQQLSAVSEGLREGCRAAASQGVAKGWGGNAREQIKGELAHGRVEMASCAQGEEGLVRGLRQRVQHEDAHDLLHSHLLKHAHGTLALPRSSVSRSLAEAPRLAARRPSFSTGNLV